MVAAQVLLVIERGICPCLDKPIRLAPPVVVVPAQGIGEQCTLRWTRCAVFYFAAVFEQAPQTIKVFTLGEYGTRLYERLATVVGQVAELQLLGEFGVLAQYREFGWWAGSAGQI